MSDVDKPTGWWVRTYAGYTVGWLVSKTDMCTTLAPVVTNSGKPFCEVHAFPSGSIIEEGPVMLGLQVTREEYEAHQKLLAEYAQQRNPILDDVKFIESKMGTRKSAHLDELDRVIDSADNPTHIVLLGEDQEEGK